MQTREGTRKKRPVLVWVITIFFFVSAIWTLLGFYLLVSGTASLTPAQKSYLESLTAIDYTFTLLLGLTNLIGAIALFLLRKAALYFFVGALALNGFMSVWHAISKGWLEALGGAGALGALFGLGIAVAVCLYVWKLAKSGVLS